MGPGFQRDSTARDLAAEDSVNSFRRRQAMLQNHVACLIQNAVMAGSISQIQTDGQFGLLDNLVATLRNSANLLHSRSRLLCFEHVGSLGGVSHPVETGLLPF